MTAGQAQFPLAPSMFTFAQHGHSGMWISELLPNIAKMSDDLCFIRSMKTDAINHEPAITFLQTGNQVTGRPCLGAWASYGLGSMNEDLPTFVVMVARPTNQEQMQAISARLWSSGALPGAHAGVSFRTSGDPILFLENPRGVSDAVRRRTLDGIGELNQRLLDDIGDPQTRTRMEQYELAYRMQLEASDAFDLSKEPDHISDLYGRATHGRQTLIARRLLERGVRYIQLWHGKSQPWDHHDNIRDNHAKLARELDQPVAALLKDLKQRGMLEDTLVIFGGEFGRTPMFQGKGGAGRDHHIKGFSMWMAGGGVKPGMSYGETDELGYNAAKDIVHVRDFHATLLHLLGIDHHRFSTKFQGLDMRLTGVEPAKVIKQLLA